jgi:hypothetical protein
MTNYKRNDSCLRRKMKHDPVVTVVVRHLIDFWATMQKRELNSSMGSQGSLAKGVRSLQGQKDGLMRFATLRTDGAKHHDGAAVVNFGCLVWK